MIPRYTLPEMGEIWSDESKFSAWLHVEIAVLQERAQRGDFSLADCAYVADNAEFEVERIEERIKTLLNKKI